jgi:flagellar biosynthesis/type III secretory pathway protein FliH
MSTRLQRYDFGALRDFRGPIVLRTLAQNQIEDVVAVPPEPVFTSAEMDAARLSAKKQGFSEGYQAGTDDAQKKHDHMAEQVNETILALQQHLEKAEQNHQQVMTEQSAVLQKLVLAIARKVAGHALSTRGEEEALTMVERCIPAVFSKPRLTITLHPDMLERCRPRLEEKLMASSYRGTVEYLKNTALGFSDITLDWGSGEASRREADLWNEINAILQRIPLELTFAQTLTPPTGEDHGR